MARLANSSSGVVDNTVVRRMNGPCCSCCVCRCTNISPRANLRDCCVGSKARGTHGAAAGMTRTGGAVINRRRPALRNNLSGFVG